MYNIEQGYSGSAKNQMFFLMYRSESITLMFICGLLCVYRITLIKETK